MGRETEKYKGWWKWLLMWSLLVAVSPFGTLIIATTLRLNFFEGCCVVVIQAATFIAALLAVDWWEKVIIRKREIKKQIQSQIQ
jgi:hypothetical protein